MIAKWLERSLNKTQYHKRSITEMTQWFIPWFGQDQRLPTPRCGVPTDEGCNQPLSSGPKTHLNTTVFCLLFLNPVCEESPQLGASRPYNEDHKRCMEVREGREHTQDSNHSTITHTSHKDHRKYAHTRPRLKLKRLAH